MPHYFDHLLYGKYLPGITLDTLENIIAHYLSGDTILIIADLLVFFFRNFLIQKQNNHFPQDATLFLLSFYKHSSMR